MRKKLVPGKERDGAVQQKVCWKGTNNHEKQTYVLYNFSVSISMADMEKSR